MSISWEEAKKVNPFLELKHARGRIGQVWLFISWFVLDSASQLSEWLKENKCSKSHMELDSVVVTSNLKANSLLNSWFSPSLEDGFQVLLDLVVVPFSTHSCCRWVFLQKLHQPQECTWSFFQLAQVPSHICLPICSQSAMESG